MKKKRFRSPNKPETDDPEVKELGEELPFAACYCPCCGAIIEDFNDCYECGWERTDEEK